MTLEAWERRTDWPMTVLAVVFLAVYAWPILDPGLGSPLTTALGWLNVAIWALFAVDYAARVSLAPERRAYVRSHWYDVPLLMLPMLRPLRALRAVLALKRMGRRARLSFRGGAITLVICAVPLVVFVAALAVLDAERSDADANIVSFGDALWWASTTVATVGYGDRVPVTTEGRLVAVGLMLAGIGLVGVVTATLASWFVEKLGAVEAAEEQTASDVAAVAAELRALRRDLDSRS
jgi:voltage-gated potassium channel